jgi:hypothetical protein
MKATDNFINQAGERAAQIAPKITVPSNPDQTFASVAVNVAQQVCALLETTGWDGDVKIPGVDAWVARNASNQLFFLQGFHIPNDSLNSPCSPADAEQWLRLWVEYWAPATTLTIWGDGTCHELSRFDPDICEPPEQALAWWETASEPWACSVTITDKAQEDDLVSTCDRTAAVEGYCFD